MIFCSFEFNFVTFMDILNKECKDVFSLKFMIIGRFFFGQCQVGECYVFFHIWPIVRISFEFTLSIRGEVETSFCSLIGLAAK